MSSAATAGVTTVTRESGTAVWNGASGSVAEPALPWRCENSEARRSRARSLCRRVGLPSRRRRAGGSAELRSPCAGPRSPAAPTGRASRDPARGNRATRVGARRRDPVVLVHGSLETLDSWRPQIAAFATRFHVIAYSRRYHPPNAVRPDGEGYALSLHGNDLIALIEGLGL